MDFNLYRQFDRKIVDLTIGRDCTMLLIARANHRYSGRSFG